MKRLFAVLGLVLIGGVGAVLIYAATVPDTFRVSRSTSIRAPRDKVFALIDDLNRFNQWNPFAKLDPSTKTTYRGPANGKGAAFDWTGTGQAGTGSLEIVDAEAPANVRMKLDMLKPMEGHNTVVFALRQDGDVTDVSWTMTGPFPYLNRVLCTVFNMDKMIGGTFETGLADLKRLAEQS